MKKIIFLLTTLFRVLITSCDNTNCSTCYQRPKRVYKEEICPKCNGTGTVPQTTSQKVGFALVTFGMTLMCDDEEQCPKCHGSGIIKIPVLNDSIIIE